MRNLWPALCLLATTAAAQAPVHVTARVVDRSTLQPIDGAGVRIDDVLTAVVSSGGGNFAIDVAPGRHRLVVGAAGYTLWQRDFDFQRDTSIVVDLGHETFTLDTVRARAGTVKAKLTFRDSATRHLMIDVQATTVNESVVSSHTGTVTLHVPIGVSTQVLVEAFPYLAERQTLNIRKDTSYAVWMRINHEAVALIDKQTAWFAERAQPLSVAGKSSLDNRELSLGSDASLGSVIKREGFDTRVACVVVDDKPSGEGWRNLATLMPEQVERVERLQFGPYRDVMLRVYTRDYIRNVILGIIRPHEIVFVNRGKFCR